MKLFYDHFRGPFTALLQGHSRSMAPKRAVKGTGKGRERVKLKILISLLGSFALLDPVVSYAQRTLDMNPNSFQNQMGRTGQTYPQGSVYGNPVMETGDEDEQQPADTTQKERRLRRPLESYFFPDSMINQTIFKWTIRPGYNDVVMQKIDTSLVDFVTRYPYLRNDVGSIHLGQMGAASIPLNFTLQPRFRDFEFARAYDPYLITPERAYFFNTKKPFTLGEFFYSGQNRRLEEEFRIVHAQNISPSTGFNVDYRSVGARGIFTNQATRNKALSLAFSHTGKKYSVHGGYIFNSIANRENGGVINDSMVTDIVLEMPEMVPMRLSSPRNILKNNTFYLVQSYGVPLSRGSENGDLSIADRSSFFLGHSIVYSRFFRKYTDTRAGTRFQQIVDGRTVLVDFFDNWFIDGDQSRDSVFESLLSNRLFIQIQPWDRNSILGVVTAGVGNDAHLYHNFTLASYLHGSKNVRKNGSYLYGSAQGKLSRYFDWNANLQYHAVGYRSGDIDASGGLSLSAFIKDRPVTLEGNLEYRTSTPGYWMENYFSNHFAWNNSFSKENETLVSAALKIPALDFEVGGWHSITADKIYFGADRLPSQNSGNVNVSGLYAKKNFRLGGFHLDNRVLFQSSSDQKVVPVPTGSLHLRYYYEFNVVKNVLRMQIGLDGRYFTKFYAPGFNPATSQFYNQREKEMGEYPLVDAFAAAKWKRMRILLTYQHVNQGMFGERNYFSAPHYPLNWSVFKLGISWAFYD